MCLAALQAARVARVVYGAPDLRLGAVASFHQLLEKRHPFHPHLEVESGLLANASADLLRSFFAAKRQERKPPLSKVSVGARAEAAAARRAAATAQAAQPSPWATDAGGAALDIASLDKASFSLSNSTAYQPSPLRFVDRRGRPVMVPKARTMPPLETFFSDQPADANSVAAAAAAAATSSPPAAAVAPLGSKRSPLTLPPLEQSLSAEHYVTLRPSKGTGAELSLHEAQAAVAKGNVLPYPWSLLREQQRRSLQIDAPASAAAAVVTQTAAAAVTASRDKTGARWVLVARAQAAALRLRAKAAVVPLALLAGSAGLAVGTIGLFAAARVVVQAVGQVAEQAAPVQLTRALISKLNAKLDRCRLSAGQKAALLVAAAALGGYAAWWAGSEVLLLVYKHMA
jgi:hypothetical protein